MRILRRVLLFAALAIAAHPYAAAQPQTITVDEALDRVLKDSYLTDGKTPFHAVMAISGPLPAYSGQIDLLWLAPKRYRLQITSPAFKQLRIMNDDQVQEQNDGDFYPRWLQSFVDALLDPLHVEASFRGRQYAIATDPGGSTCIKRDDGTNGISDEMTWSNLCFIGPGPLLRSVITFNYDMEFADYRPFGHQQIPRDYRTVLNSKTITGLLTTLEEVEKPDLAQVTITNPTPAQDRIETGFVSTLKEESLIDHPPTFDWPAVREGKTEGYMIVYARTDRTGQVRETSKFNSDNPGLEQFGMEQALTLRFHPLLVDGVAQQMEMPLVLHFTSKMGTPLPELDDRQTRAQISGCSIPHPKQGQRPFRIRVSVNEVGKLTGEGYPDANIPDAPHHSSVSAFSLMNCRFKPYLVNGVPTYYHGELLLP